MSRDRRVLVVGSGVAGLSFALKLAELADVTVVTKKHRAESNTNYAQGGIAAVLGAEDSPADHVRDTVVAGAGLCHVDAVERLVREGPERIHELLEWGVAFSRTGERLHLGREGGHSHRRIVHALDRTGRAIESALLEAVAAHPSIDVLEDHLAVDLVVAGGARAPRCGGCVVYDRTAGEPLVVRAHFTLLATGGLGRVYLHTTNPAIATGDGLAMAWRAGARVANLEFVQFHPSALYPAEDRAVLISEAVRGEGARLLTVDGRPLMAGHPDGSLATRDVVARAIDMELKRTGATHALLDATSIPADVLERRFPNIVAECADRGLDMTTEPVPIVPAAHYACGGVSTDADGRTSIDRLFAVGEVAFTGVHGANRLASNSLLEAVVYSHRAAIAVANGLEETRAAGPVGEPTDATVRGPDREDRGTVEARIRSLMWEDVGIVRTDERLRRAVATLDAWSADPSTLEGLSGSGRVEARNLLLAARLVARCAGLRKESRGLHHNLDHPEADPAFLHDTVLRP
ncbi:MAG TPA: L-aspartate oxidase [Longimicrobiales bacterium]|nr:L-aspartate oxidase [Longimicrobiales bacterium]